MKLKRLVSAVLAVGMALTILPTAAFAADTSTTPVVIRNMVLTADGKVDETASGATNEKTPNSYWYWYENGNTNRPGWFRGMYNLMNIYSGAVFDEQSISSDSPRTDFGETVNNYGTIKSGKFGTVYNYGGGLIEGGEFNFLINVTSTSVVKNSLVKRYSVARQAGGTLEDSVVWGSLKEDFSSTIKNSILPSKPEKSTTSESYVVDASGCTLSGTFNEIMYSIKDKMCIVGDETSTPGMEFRVEPSSKSRTITGWKVVNATYTPNTDGSITVTVSANNTEDVEIAAIREEVPLTVSNNLPADGKNDDDTYGSPYDGWNYSETESNNKITKNLKVYATSNSNAENTVNIGNEQVDWTIQNNGTIAEGKFTGIVNNYGNITGGTYTGNFYNRNTTDNPNANAVREEGIVTSGVFSRSADFGTQNPDITWLTVKNNATINGIKDFTMAGIVGEQSVTITAPDGFKCWSVAGDTDFALTEEQKHSNPLTLKLNGEDKGTIILTAQSEEGYYPLNLTDGKAYSVTADGAKDQEITAARAGDTVILEADATLIPDGMVFDRWEITGDTELTGGFDANAEKTQFTMPNAGVTIRAMYRMADVEEPNVLGTAAVIGTVAVGGAVIAWQGYNIAADLYARDILPEGTAIPETKEALAVMLWQNAGKPEVVAADGTALSETEQAQQWVVANGLMENEADGTFHPEKGVGKFAALNAIKEQNEARVNE